MLMFVIACLWAFALAKVFGLEPPLSRYRVEVIQWDVPVSRDGRRAILNGTIQQVYQQLLEINPNYEAEFGPAEGKYTPGLSQVFGSYELAERRDTWSDCGRFDAAKAVPIWEGINHLNHVSGTPVSRPGPGTCGRKDTERSLSSYHEIANSVQLLTMNCTYWSESHLEPQVSGQQFHIDKWSTVVKGAIC
ncbi:hypothetical protein SLS64_011758 [Diaporthe eres]|uniref:Secreted protein n=1 Tax=Diaporthe eres TaxID=83184 RepID=A0ABR1P297_DIAER